MDFHKFKVNTDMLLHNPTIELDGVPLKGVKNISFQVGVDNVAEVTLVLIADALEIQADANIKGILEKATRQPSPVARREVEVPLTPPEPPKQPPPPEPEESSIDPDLQDRIDEFDDAHKNR